jgi:hypothetical protein
LHRRGRHPLSPKSCAHYIRMTTRDFGEGVLQAILTRSSRIWFPMYGYDGPLAHEQISHPQSVSGDCGREQVQRRRGGGGGGGGEA